MYPRVDELLKREAFSNNLSFRFSLVWKVIRDINVLGRYKNSSQIRPLFLRVCWLSMEAESDLIAVLIHTENIISESPLLPQ